jgi:hypothetical protein
MRLWEVCCPLAACLDERGYCEFVSAALRTQAATEITQQLLQTAEGAGVYFGNRTWGRLAGEAGKAAGREVTSAAFAFIWENSGSCQFCFGSEEWASFAWAAGKNGRRDVLEKAWEACCLLAADLDERGYYAFVTAALRTRASAELIRQMLWAAKTAGVQFPSSTWGRLAWEDGKAAGKPVTGDALAAIWEESTPSHQDFGAREWGAFARAAGETGRRDLLEKVWTAHKAHAAALDADAWMGFAEAAGNAQHREALQEMWAEWWNAKDQPEQRILGAFGKAAGRTYQKALLREVWMRWRRSRLPLSEIGWGSFISAAGTVKDAKLLSIVRRVMQRSSLTMEASIFGTLVTAAADVGRGDWVGEVWETYLSSGVQLNSRAWGAFATALRDAERADLFPQLWDAFRAGGGELDPVAWGMFGVCAADAERPDLLGEVFRAWTPQQNTLLQGEHVAWALFFGAAYRIEQEHLFLEMLQRLESHSDPVRLTNRGSLGPILRGYGARLRDAAIRAEVMRKLNGLDLDVARCLSLLETATPSEDYSGRGYSPFEGAGRCLMAWLISSYYNCDVEEFAQRLARLVDGMLSLKANQQRAWHALLSRAQGVYAGCLVGRCLGWFKERLAWIEEADDERLTAALRDGSVVAEIEAFRRDLLVNSLPQFEPQIARDAQAHRLSPVIDFLLSNWRAYQQTRKLGDARRFGAELADKLAAAHVDSFSRDDWMDALRLLLWRMSAGVCDELFPRLWAKLHSEKTKLSEEEARAFVRSLESEFRRFNAGERRRVNIAFDVRRLLLAGRHNLPTTIGEIERPFDVALWHGARRELLEPMLKEIRFNAEHALRRLPPEAQFYRVTLRRGEGEDAIWGLLVVTNACPAEEAPHSTSTKRGLGIVQEQAFALGGTAVWHSGTDDGRNVFTWTVRLPLWQGEEAEEEGERT